MGGGIGVESFFRVAVVQEAVTAIGQEGGQLLGWRQGDQVAALLDLGVRDLLGPLLVVLVRVAVGAAVAGGLDIEPLVSIVPADEDVASGQHHFERIAQTSPHGHIQGGHRGAGAAVGVVDHAVNQEILGVAKIDVADALHVIVDAAVLVEYLGQHLGTQPVFRMLVMICPLRIVGAVKMAFGLELHPRRPLVERGEALVDAEVLRARQTSGAKQVHLGDVHVG